MFFFERCRWSSARVVIKSFERCRLLTPAPRIFQEVALAHVKRWHDHGTGKCFNKVLLMRQCTWFVGWFFASCRGLVHWFPGVQGIISFCWGWEILCGGQKTIRKRVRRARYRRGPVSSTLDRWIVCWERWAWHHRGGEVLPHGFSRQGVSGKREGKI